MKAGKLRHRLTIEAPSTTQDPETGALVVTWAPIDTVHASIEPLSVRDYVAAQTLKSKVSVRIVIRWRSGLRHDMRFVDERGTRYIPQGFLADPTTGKEFLTIPCSTEA